METCPECGTGRDEADASCPRCARGADGGEGPDGRWAQAAETSQVYEAELIVLRLREAGIDAQVVDQTFHQEPMPNVRDLSVVRVLVPADRLEEARGLLAESVALPADAEASGTIGEGDD